MEEGIVKNIIVLRFLLAAILAIYVHPISAAAGLRIINTNLVDFGSLRAQIDLAPKNHAYRINGLVVSHNEYGSLVDRDLGTYAFATGRALFSSGSRGMLNDLAASRMGKVSLGQYFSMDPAMRSRFEVRSEREYVLVTNLPPAQFPPKSRIDLLCLPVGIFTNSEPHIKKFDLGVAATSTKTFAHYFEVGLTNISIRKFSGR
jgi:hypothetical protein